MGRATITEERSIEVGVWRWGKVAGDWMAYQRIERENFVATPAHTETIEVVKANGQTSEVSVMSTAGPIYKSNTDKIGLVIAYTKPLSD